MISVESVRLSRLVDNLLDLSQLQSGAVEPHADWCSIEELVRAAIDSVAQPPGGFDIQIDPGLPLLRADAGPARARHRQRPRERRPLLGRRAGQRAGPRRAQPGASAGHRSRSGRPREDLERIFEAFHSLGDGSGTGLGLAIARGFVEANGGRIRAESLPGQGTTIVLSLPVPVEQPTEAVQASETE